MTHLFLLLALFFSTPAQAEVVYTARDQDGKVVELTNEPCMLPAVANLSRRAVWREPGKVYEGCYGAQFGAVVMYFADRTVIIAPMNAFTRVLGL
jgi:hypothetical protein